jgi:hypothetical protein
MLSMLHERERDHLARNEIMVPALALYQAGGKTHVLCRCPICSREQVAPCASPFGLVRFAGAQRHCKHAVAAVIAGNTPAFGTEGEARRFLELCRAAGGARQEDTLWRLALERIDEAAETP